MTLDDLGNLMAQQQAPSTREQAIVAARQNELANANYSDSTIDKQSIVVGAGRFDVHFLDRMLKIRLPPKEQQNGVWILKSPEILETLSLLNLDESSYRYFRRELLELVAIASGEGNEAVLADKLGLILAASQLTRSRSDLPELGIRERTGWISTRSTEEKSIRLPEDTTVKRGGILGALGFK